VTIDFGDGRKLQRTITGNSIHYILDPEGNIADALPGLYSATAFATELKAAADAVTEARNRGVHDYGDHLKSTEARLLNAWSADLTAIHVGPPKVLSAASLGHMMDDQKWQQIAALHRKEATFDPQVREVMARKYPDARTAAPVAVGKAAVERPMLKVISNLGDNVALDTVRDNYMLRSKILEFLSSSGRSLSLAQLNNWVYDKIFLTPRQDPWLGLAPADVFSGIDANGEGK
jgi:hypothetical protein